MATKKTEQAAPAPASKEALASRFKPNFELKVDHPIMAKLKEQYGTQAVIKPAQHPAEKTTSAAGNEYKNTYKGFVVAQDKDYIAQRVDTGSTQTKIVLHARDQVEAPERRDGKTNGLSKLMDENKLTKHDVSINYDSEGKGNIYNHYRALDKVRDAAETLKTHSGLEGKQAETFNSQIKTALESNSKSFFDKQIELSQKYMENQARQAQAHSMVQEHGSSVASR